MMERLSPILESHGTNVYFYCSACKMQHGIQVRGDVPPLWGWNGDCVRPTFTPSILVTGVQLITDDEHKRLMDGETIEPRPLLCHSFVTDGQIQYLSDCKHALAGKTIPLPNLDDEA